MGKWQSPNIPFRSKEKTTNSIKINPIMNSNIQIKFKGSEIEVKT